MAIWIEIRCEGGVGRNGDPGRLCCETSKDVLSAKREIEVDAIKVGYKKMRDGWYCPLCS